MARMGKEIDDVLAVLIEQCDLDDYSDVADFIHFDEHYFNNLEEVDKAMQEELYYRLRQLGYNYTVS